MVCKHCLTEAFNSVEEKKERSKKLRNQGFDLERKQDSLLGSGLQNRMGVIFIKILREAFTNADPKSEKKDFLCIRDLWAEKLLVEC